ncbi:MAG: M23 family metallopeptidase [Oscillospiraceae bacterium]|nr:M23 family metallopeptidase [Oscillospiraceae bacterium]
MVMHLNKWKLLGWSAGFLLIFSGIVAAVFFAFAREESEKTYIKWAELNVSLAAMEDAMELDISTYDKLYHISWIDTLSYLACKNGNNWQSYRKKDITAMLEKLGDLYTVDDLMQGNKYYAYYKQAFGAALGGILGCYEKQAPDGNGGKKVVSGYGIVAYSPIAEGFSYSHYDDFGNSRSYGYRRRHLGNDLMGNVGTPIVSVEGGRVECIGWNQYGGWRLGIRSFDGKRSYYYAHLRKDSPYAEGIELGSLVKAGQVIGYLGMTGYSTKSNVNGMNVPHLHFGLQLIFDESQKEGVNQIWLDVYSLVKLLSRNRATVVRDEKTKQYSRKYDIIVDSYPPELQKFYDGD